MKGINGYLTSEKINYNGQSGRRVLDIQHHPHQRLRAHWRASSTIEVKSASPTQAWAGMGSLGLLDRQFQDMCPCRFFNEARQVFFCTVTLAGQKYSKGPVGVGRHLCDASLFLYWVVSEAALETI